MPMEVEGDVDILGVRGEGDGVRFTPTLKHGIAVMDYYMLMGGEGGGGSSGFG